MMSGMSPLGGGIEVRRATVADVPAMAAAREGDSDAGPADHRMATYLEGRHHPRAALPSRVGLVAEANGTVAGYIAGHRTRRFGCDGELQYLYVVPSRRRSGIASALLRCLAEWFVSEGARRICVDVDPDSPVAGPFYAKHGAALVRPHWMEWQDIGLLLPGERRP